MAALAPDDVWAVGHYMGPFAITHTLVEHWDGRQWSVVPSPDGRSGGNHLNGVWALSADDVWAVGNSNEFTDFSPQTLILHWDGTRWEVVPSPNIGSRTNSLTSITGTAHNDVWAAGYYYDVSSGVTYTMLQHWDGTEWKLVPSPNAGAANVLQGISAVAPDDVWAVGYYTASGGTYTLVLHWNGKVWEIVPSPSIGSFSQLNSVSGSATGDLWAAGYYFDGERSGTLILHWNGSTWSVEPSPDPAEASSTLTGVSTVSSGDVWVVGESHPNGAGARTLTARYSSSCATPVPTSTALVTPTACTVAFTDVPPGSTFYPYVRCLSCMGIISGYSSGCEAGSLCFRVSNSVTRGQLTKIVSNAAGFSDPPGVQLFEDVPPGHAFYSYIQRLASRGYIGGYRCGGPGEPCVPPGSRAYFRPGSDVTRGQLAKIVSTAAGFGGIPGFQLFEDVPPDHTFFTDTQMLGRRWIMDGYLCGTPGEPCLPPYGRRYFRPANSATRGQTSKIVANTFFPGCNPP